ncbi:PilZ domain-containing protein [bacterium]|nr:PilZ domain-containing protein [bacterium]
MSSLWSLYNKSDKIQIDDLKTEQVKVVLLSISSMKMKDWEICKKGTVHWQPLALHPDFYEEVENLKGSSMGPTSSESASTPPYQNAPSSGESKSSLFDEIDLDSEETLSLMDGAHVDVEERRSARRHHRILKFEIIQGEKRFETETKDISMSGMKLKEPLPDWIKSEFRAQVSLNDQVVDLRVARLSKDKKDTSVKILDASTWGLLKSWVIGW